jgi:NAD-dependent DNA ligase
VHNNCLITTASNTKLTPSYWHVLTITTELAHTNYNYTTQQLIKAEYEKQQSSSLKKAIEKETSGALEKALVALLSPSITAYTAQALNESFEGIGVVSHFL